MRIDFKFRHLEPSDELTSYVSERITKLEKFEMKPVRAEFTFSVERAVRRVDVHVRGQDIEMHAHSEAEDYFQGIDMVLDKIARQLARKKSRVQAHKSKTPKAPKVG
jgi:putative sigma-54 modulation protein